MDTISIANIRRAAAKLRQEKPARIVNKHTLATILHRAPRIVAAYLTGIDGLAEELGIVPDIVGQYREAAANLREAGCPVTRATLAQLLGLRKGRVTQYLSHHREVVQLLGVATKQEDLKRRYREGVRAIHQLNGVVTRRELAKIIDIDAHTIDIFFRRHPELEKLLGVLTESEAREAERTREYMRQVQAA